MRLKSSGGFILFFFKCRLYFFLFKYTLVNCVGCYEDCQYLLGNVWIKTVIRCFKARTCPCAHMSTFSKAIKDIIQEKSEIWTWFPLGMIQVSKTVHQHILGLLLMWISWLFYLMNVQYLWISYVVQSLSCRSLGVSFFLLLSFNFWTWLYSFTIFHRGGIQSNQQPAPSRLMHGVHCGSAVFPYRAL